MDLLGPAAELVACQALDQKPRLVILGQQLLQHLLQERRIVRQSVSVAWHTAMMNDRFASLPELVARNPASSGRRRGAGARHSHSSSSAASRADDNAIRPDVCVGGQAN